MQTTLNITLILVHVCDNWKNRVTLFSVYDRESQMAWTPTGDILGKPMSSPDSSLSSLVNQPHSCSLLTAVFTLFLPPLFLFFILVWLLQLEDEHLILSCF